VTLCRTDLRRSVRKEWKEGRKEGRKKKRKKGQIYHREVWKQAWLSIRITNQIASLGECKESQAVKLYIIGVILLVRFFQYYITKKLFKSFKIKLSVFTYNMKSLRMPWYIYQRKTGSYVNFT
jgi:hypothetical protein